MALIAAAAVYPYLPGLDSGADAAVNTVIAAVESQLATYCGWYAGVADGSVSWDTATRTFYLDAPSAIDARMLQLPVQPVTAITVINDDSLWVYGAASLVAASNYTLVADEGQVWLDPDASHAWSSAKRIIRVICVAGFATAPRQLALAIYRQTAAAWQLQHGGAGRTRASTGRTSTTFKLPPITDDVRALLKPFRCPNFWLD